MSTKVNASVSFPFLSMLCLLFIGLKLGEVGVVATWSWWWGYVTNLDSGSDLSNSNHNSRYSCSSV